MQLVLLAATLQKKPRMSAGMFLVMALYGYITRTDLSQLGSIVLMVLFGLLIGLFVNIFLQSSKFDIILSTAGVFIFFLVWFNWIVIEIMVQMMDLLFGRLYQNRGSVLSDLPIFSLGISFLGCYSYSGE